MPVVNFRHIHKLNDEWLLTSSCVSDCLSTQSKLAATEWIIVKVYVWGVFEILS